MSESLTLARPYARAAFELARDTQSLADWSRALAFAADVAGDPGIAGMRNDPRVDESTLVAMHLPAQQSADSPFARLLVQMAEHGRLGLLPEVAELFEAMRRDVEAVLKVRLTSAMACDEAQLAALKDALKRRYQRDIDLDTTLEPDLIGGAIIDIGGEVIDGTARGRLEQLASALGRN